MRFRVVVVVAVAVLILEISQKEYFLSRGESGSSDGDSEKLMVRSSCFDKLPNMPTPANLL